MIPPRFKRLIPLLCCLIVTACGQTAPQVAGVQPNSTVTSATHTPATPTARPPTATTAPAARSAWPVPDWQSASPESRGMDSRQLAQMLEFIRDQKLDIHSVLIARHGVLVHETYFYPYAPETPHAIYSATKSVSGALIGLAIAEGKIPSAQTPLLDLFPERTVQNVDARKQAITLEHLLTMSSGLSWRRPASGGPPPVYAFQNSDDPVQFVLDRPVDDEPGSRFFYNSGGSHLLSAIVQERTGQTALDYARQKLFGPLGINDVSWESAAQGVNDGGTGIWLRPRDMARFGLLYLRQGEWDGRQILPAEWVAASTTRHMPAPDKEGQGYPPTPNLVGYGYQWWINALGGYSAIGFGEQEIIVLPEQDLVVVITGTTPESGSITPEDLTRKFIVPAVKSANPLPENPVAAERLAALSQSLSAAPSPQPIAPLPAIAGEISGKRYEIRSEDGRQVESFALTFGAEDASYSGMIDGQAGTVTVGLDGVDRRTATEAGNVLARGVWQDERTFVIDLNLLGEAMHEEATFTFEGERVTAAFRSYVYGNVFTMHGRQTDAAP
ncbi:MAG TPA: serine hydrolase [Herpetosiphonaceae bacterium]